MADPAFVINFDGFAGLAGAGDQLYECAKQVMGGNGSTWSIEKIQPMDRYLSINHRRNWIFGSYIDPVLQKNLGRRILGAIFHLLAVQFGGNVGHQNISQRDSLVDCVIYNCIVSIYIASSIGLSVSCNTLPVRDGMVGNKPLLLSFSFSL